MKRKAPRATYKVSEIACHLGITTQTFRNWLRRDGIEVERSGGAWLVPTHAIRAHYPVAWYAIRLELNLE